MNKKKIIYIILMLLLFCSMMGCVETEKSEQNEKKAELNISQMQAVCELATLECYYHNTAKFNSEKKCCFGILTKHCGLSIREL